MGKVAAAMIVAYALFSAGGSMLGWLDNSQQASEVNDELQTKRAQLNQSQRSIDAFDENTSLWTSVVALYDTYLPNKHTPFDFVTSLAAQFDENTRLISMDWVAPVVVKEETSNNRRSRRSRRANQNTEPKAATTITVVVEFNGSYTTQDDYISDVEAFYARVQEGMKAYAVTPKDMPGRTDPTEEQVLTLDDDIPEPFKGENTVEFSFSGPIEERAS